jgi:NAD(P)-dependent dehydrogenase (short-subunit alcohol dehydrogenase family)
LSIDPRTYTYTDDTLRERIILVTGASDGIGRALALEAARLGAQVILHGRNTKKLESVYDEIEAMDGAKRPSIAVLDLASANAENYATLAKSIEDEFGRLDGLVHNASILGERYSVEQYDAVIWQRVMHVNVTAAFAMTQVLLPMLQKSEDASIIFTSSGVGRTGKAFWGAYAVSKFATEGLSQVLADEHRHSSLR